jgi:hypothetical protein
MPYGFRTVRRTGPGLALLLAASGVLAGCGIAGSGGIADRCAAIAEAAMPAAELDLDKRSAAAAPGSLTKVIAHVEGARTDLPDDSPLSREIAAECEFDGSALTGFHWTKGGPQTSARPPG